MGIFWLKDSLDQNRFLVRQILGKFFSSKKKRSRRNLGPKDYVVAQIICLTNFIKEKLFFMVQKIMFPKQRQEIFGSKNVLA